LEDKFQQESMANVSSIISLENDIFKIYVFWTGVLVIKVLLMAFLTVIQRVKNKVRFCQTNLIKTKNIN
jgi:hypothetical protein